MRRYPTAALGVALLGGLLAGGRAKADFVYRFEQSNYDVAAGAGVDVNVYLHESGTSVLNTGGLISAGVLVQFSGTSQVLSAADIGFNPAFDAGAPLNQTSFNPAASAGLAEAVGLLSPPVFADASGDVLLGTFHFTAGASGVTSLRAGDFSSAIETVTGAGAPLDDVIGEGSATITVQPSAVPEPSTLALAGIGLAGLWLYRRRRRKQDTSAA